MLDLSSEQWASLRVPTGYATRVPGLIAALRSDPSIKSFDAFWEELTGEGDLAIHDAFFAAVPHAIAALPLLDGQAREEGVAQIGWGIALADENEIAPPCLMEDFCGARQELVKIASALLEGGVSAGNRLWIVAAVHAGNGRFAEALSIIADL